MGSDNSRNTHRKEKHYSKVNWQQGRVQVDADPNEQTDILNHFERTAVRDVVGKSGVPAETPAAFLIASSGTDYNYLIGPGRFYVDGILVENGENRDFIQAAAQPDLPAEKDGTSLALPSVEGVYLVYL